MKYFLVLFLPILSSLSVIGQPDTLFLTLEQEKTFNSVLDGFQQRRMDVDHIYMENERFDSLVSVIDEIRNSRRYKHEDINHLYQKAKKIYPKSWDVLQWENPTGCFFGNDIIERTQERLRDCCNLCIQLRGPNEFGLTKNQSTQVHKEQMDNYLSTLEFAFHFMDKNLEGRLWVHLYFSALEKAQIVLLDD